MKSVRVMQVTDSLNAAGRERMTVNLANLMGSRGYDSYLCTTRTEGPLLREVSPTVRRLRLARTHRIDVRAFREFVYFIRRNRIDILHAHGASLFIAGMASLFPPYPVVVWHDNEGNHGQTERSKWLYRLGATRVGGVISATRPLADWAETKLNVRKDRIWFLPNCVETVVPAKEASNLPGSRETRIVCVAGLRRQKDHITLLRAMAEVIKKVQSAHLLIVGGAKDKDYLDEIHRVIQRLKLTEHISFLGEQQDIHAILQGCRVGVLSSSSEAFPLALLEYGVAGLPVVVTRVGQCAEVLDEGKAGLLVAPKSPNDLAEALLTLLRDSDQCSDFGKRLKLRVEEMYSPDRIADEVTKIYETVLTYPKHARRVS